MSQRVFDVLANAHSPVFTLCFIMYWSTRAVPDHGFLTVPLDDAAFSNPDYRLIVTKIDWKEAKHASRA